MKRIYDGRFTIYNLSRNSMLFVVFLTLNFKLQTLNCYAQQYPQMSQYMFNKIFVNPAFCGNTPVLNVSLDYRQQYMGFEGAPTTQFLSASLPFQLKNMAVGLKVINDKVGINNSLNVNLVYAFQMGFGPGKLSMAIEGGMVSNTINFSSLRKHDELDESIPESSASKLVPDAHFGLYYNTEKWFVGFTAFNLIQSKIIYGDGNVGQKLAMHFVGLAGYGFPIGKDLKIEPSVLFKNVKGVPSQLDINTSIYFKTLFSVGASYRLGDALAAIVSFNVIEELKIGYSYDLTMSELKTYHSGGAHEIALIYNYKLPAPPRKKTVDPRYYY